MHTLALSEHLPKVLSSFLASHAGIFVDLERPSDEIVNVVRNDVCSIGMVSDWVDLQGLQILAFCADALVRVVPRGHALSQRAAVSLSEVGVLRSLALPTAAPCKRTSRITCAG